MYQNINIWVKNLGEILLLMYLVSHLASSREFWSHDRDKLDETVSCLVSSRDFRLVTGPAINKRGMPFLPGSERDGADLEERLVVAEVVDLLPRGRDGGAVVKVQLEAVGAHRAELLGTPVFFKKI